MKDDANYTGKAPVSSEVDWVDPIYKNKDPISVSLAMRKVEGSYTSVIPSLRQGLPYQNKYFFTLR